MKIFITTFVIAVSGAISLSAQDMPFVFDEKKINVGSMYVYEYSRNNIENFVLSQKYYLYFKTRNIYEIIQINIKEDQKAIPFIFEIKKMNWNLMMIEESERITLRSDNELQIGYSKKSTIKFDPIKGITQYTYLRKTKNGFEEEKEIYKPCDLPTYYYQNDDLLSLCLALRFYPFEKEKITVNHKFVGHCTKVDIMYLGNEEIEVPYGKKLCHKYELVPQMNFLLKIFYSPEKVYIWLASDDVTQYLVRYKNNNAQSTFTSSLEYRLAEVKKMSLEEWEKFKEEHGVNVKNEKK